MITINFLFALCGALAGWFISEFEPFQVFIYGLENKFKNKRLNWVYSNIILKVFSCCKCFAFWFTLIFFLQPFTAIFASAMVYTYKRILDSKF